MNNHVIKLNCIQYNIRLKPTERNEKHSILSGAFCF